MPLHVNAGETSGEQFPHKHAHPSLVPFRAVVGVKALPYFQNRGRNWLAASPRNGIFALSTSASPAINGNTAVPAVSNSLFPVAGA